MTTSRKTRRDKIIEDPVRINTVVDRKQHEFLKLMSFKLSHHEKRRVTVCDLIRRAVAECFPVPADSQMDLF